MTGGVRNVPLINQSHKKLTRLNAESWKDVFAVICDYMALIKAAPSAALEEIMQERAQMDEKEYYFRNSSIHALDATVRAMLAPYPRSDILTGPSLCPPLNAEDLRTWIDSYIRPGKVKVLLCGGRNWLDVGTTQPDETWSVAPGFGTKYKVSRLDDNIITANYTAERALARGMGLPAPNPFVPTDFSILPVDIDASLVGSHIPRNCSFPDKQIGPLLRRQCRTRSISALVV